VRQVWEYKVVRFAGRSESEQLNALGAEGWGVSRRHLFKDQLVLFEAPRHETA